MTESQRRLLLAIRQALIIALGALEDYLGMQRSIVPKHQRRAVISGRQPSRQAGPDRHPAI